jgi:hypothetical protein
MVASLLFSTIAFDEPAIRISTRDSVPSAFSRNTAASWINFMPLFTKAPSALATNFPSFWSVTRALAPCVSQIKSYNPAGTCAPFRMTASRSWNGRGGFFLAKVGMLTPSTINVISVGNLKFIFNTRFCLQTLSFSVEAARSVSILSFGKGEARLNLAGYQNGWRHKMACNQFGSRESHLE